MPKKIIDEERITTEFDKSQAESELTGQALAGEGLTGERPAPQAPIAPPPQAARLAEEPPAWTTEPVPDEDGQTATPSPVRPFCAEGVGMSSDFKGMPVHDGSGLFHRLATPKKTKKPDAGDLEELAKNAGQEWELVAWAPNFCIAGMVATGTGEDWGVLFEWTDASGAWHQKLVQIADLVERGPGHMWTTPLRRAGLKIEDGKEALLRKCIYKLTLTDKDCLLTLARRPGWTKTKDGMRYVYPGRQSFVLTDEESYRRIYQQAGQFEEVLTAPEKAEKEGWQTLARLCVGNERLELALMTAFAGPLMMPLTIEGGGMSFEGASSSGKTTALRVAASVWGGPNYRLQWNATPNAMESLCATRNDNILIIDEINQATPKDLSTLTYMIANGRGKARQNRNSELRDITEWRTFLLSSGEQGLASILNGAKLRVNAGQEVRFVGVPVSADMIRCLHGYKDAAALVDKLKLLCGRHYGHAGTLWVQYVETHLEEITRQGAVRVQQVRDELLAANFPEGAHVPEQVQRVAVKFAAIEVAGEVAKRAGLLPVRLNTQAGRGAFKDWLENFGVMDHEQKAAIDAVRLFIEQHGQSRFQVVRQTLNDTSLEESRPVPNRAGFKEGQTYYFLPGVFNTEVLAGMNAKQAHKALFEAGMLKPEYQGKTRRFKTRKTFTGWGEDKAFYVVTLPDDEED